MTSAFDNELMLQIRKSVIKWFKSKGRKFSWRETTNTYEILIAEMLLRRTTATAVSRVYPEFIKNYPDFESLSYADEDGLEESVQSLGLQSQRSKHLKEMATYLVEKFSGELDSAKDDLQTLPGVGRYVSSAVRNFAFGEPVHMVDGNIAHLLQRLLDIVFSGPEDRLAWDLMKAIGGRKQSKHLYWGMIDLVALICLRKNPRCTICPLVKQCSFYSKSIM
ncbi:MAG: endonuclease III domain-containing protein [Candidatus Thorarchaeota archaeon]|jgi:A/G-specific adenine glycosylase